MIKTYQPIPFEGYEVMAQRNDCEKRYQAIKEHCGKILHSHIFDFGCANGFFGFRFLQDGANYVEGVEVDAECRKLIKEISEKHIGPHFNVVENIDQNRGGNYDIGIYLDLYGDSSNLPPLSFFAKCCKMLFVSPSGTDRNDALEKEAKEAFKSVTHIYTGYVQRKIFKCE